ncbi:MAG: FKBP-type peptidyl-prolyl cis-trans isomerase [Asgard group archaeon]|nr:FKBP-type peptidyl-prolyl cis-trans isomerase [Asgard group archaeon]
MVAINEGDFLRISFDLTVKSTNQLIETTDEEKAKKHGIFDEKHKYGPRLMIVGNENMFVKSINEEVVNHEVGDEFSVEVPPEETFGFHDRDKIRSVSYKDLKSKGIDPQRGKRITWGNQTGTIVDILGSRRVRVDFNHPLVGQTIVYQINIKEKISKTIEKIKALIDHQMSGIDLSKFTIKDEKNKVIITMPEEIITQDPYLQLRKVRIAQNIHKNLKNKKEITFIENFKFDSEEKEEA